MKLFPRSGFEYQKYIDQIEISLAVSKQTKIASIGSCFAREIKKYLQEKAYNYMTTETDKDIWVNRELFPGDSGKHKASHGSAAWERVYHTHTFNQIVKYSFGKKYDRIYKFEYNGKEYFTDLLRSRVVYRTYKDAKNDIENHIASSKYIFKNTELLIFTLGLTEIWETNEFVLGSLFNKIQIDKSFRATDYEENYRMVDEAISILKKENKNIEILLTVSPVHLIATSRDDLDCVSASSASKSILRVVADKLYKEKKCHYFPSYEIATIIFPLLGLQAYPDNHHVSSKVVEYIMHAFENKSLKE